MEELGRHADEALKAVLQLPGVFHPAGTDNKILAHCSRDVASVQKYLFTTHWRGALY